MSQPANLDVARAAKSQEAREAKAVLAEKNRSEFVARIAGAKARVGLLPRDLIQALAFGVTEVALMQVLTGEVKIKTAKEAIDVAKIALDIGRLEMGDPSSINEPMSPTQREDLIANAKALRAELEERAKSAARDGWDPNAAPADSAPGSSTGPAESESVSA